MSQPERERVGWPWGVRQLRLIEVLFSNGAGAESTEARLCSGEVSSQGSWGSLSRSIASFPLVLLCYRRISPMKFLMAWRNFRNPEAWAKA